jgi:type VI secretion system secreted protein Hcp
MDLILLQPGDPDFFGNDSGWDNGGSFISDQWRDSGLPLGQCIELVSIQQGMKQQVTTDVSNSARTSGRPIITEFTCVKYVDKTSVKFYDYCLRAQPIGKGARQATKIHVARNSGEKAVNIITFELRDAIISEIQFQSHPDDMPTEQFKLNFTEILWTYTMQKTDTSPSGNLSTGWSIARNRPIAKFTEDA